MTGAALHLLSVDMCAAFTDARLTPMSKSERIVELAAAEWVARFDSQRGPLVLFRDPATMNTFFLPEESLTVSGVLAALESKEQSCSAA